MPPGSAGGSLLTQSHSRAGRALTARVLAPLAPRSQRSFLLVLGSNGKPNCAIEVEADGEDGVTRGIDSPYRYQLPTSKVSVTSEDFLRGVNAVGEALFG